MIKYGKHGRSGHLAQYCLTLSSHLVQYCPTLSRSKVSHYVRPIEAVTFMKTMHSSTELQAMPFIPVVSLYVPGISLEQNISLFRLFSNTVLRDGFKIRPLMSFMNSMQPSHSYYHPLMKLFKVSHCISLCLLCSQIQ